MAAQPATSFDGPLHWLGGDQNLEPVDAGQLNGSGSFGAVGGQCDREAEHGEDVGQFLRHFGGFDIVAVDDRTRASSGGRPDR